MYRSQLTRVKNHVSLKWVNKMINNKFKSILVKKNDELLKEERMKLFKDQVKKIISNEKLDNKNEFFKISKKIFHFLFKIFLFIIRVTLIFIIMGIIAIILIGLIYPESQNQFRQIAILVWNKLIVLIEGWLN